MKILISGATGMIGTAAGALLASQGHAVWRLARRQPGPNEIRWDPARAEIDAEALRNSGPFGAVLNLAGENLAQGRWSEERKRLIVSSRIDSTQLLCRALAGLPQTPNTFLSASGIGIYGDQPERELDERSEPGHDFLAGVCRDWEAACAPLREAGTRVVNLRFGMVLSRNGGALASMLPAFKLGLGGRLGNGRQWMSWIALEDAVEAIVFLLRETSVVGPVNVASPNPVRNSEFTRLLAGSIGRPAWIPAPALGLKLAFGEMAGAILLASQRVSPSVLLSKNFPFRHPTLDSAFQSLFQRPA